MKTTGEMRDTVGITSQYNLANLSMSSTNLGMSLQISSHPGFSYTACVYGAISEATDDARKDGSRLAQKCLDQYSVIANPENFPPSLLILLVSPAYLGKEKAELLIDGIRSGFADSSFLKAQMIGTSVGGVVFDGEAHPNGALLVCIASRLNKVHVGVGKGARSTSRSDVKTTVTELLRSSAQSFPLPHRVRTSPSFHGFRVPFRRKTKST